MGKKKDDFVIINGAVKNENDAFVSIKNSGFLYGDGLFETIKAANGRVCLLEEHLERLCGSLIFFNYKIGDLQHFKNNIKNNIAKLSEIKKLNEKDAFIKIIVCREEYEKRLDYKTAPCYTIIIFMEELNHYPETVYYTGIDIIISSIKRTACDNAIYRHKVLNYLENIFARNEALSKGYDESLFISEEGFILEASTSNIFIVKKDKIFTPALSFNILPGITREKVLKICSANRIKAEEKEIHKDALFDADEIFLTNCLAGILPVKKIENQSFYTGNPDSITKKISALYKKEKL